MKRMRAGRGGWAAVAAGALVAAAFVGSARAEVERVEITSRMPYEDGRIFPGVGSYEELKGRAVFAIDPNARANARIVDVKLAPRDRRGLVEFSTDFTVLRPVKPADSTLLYDAVNRGGPVRGALEEVDDATGRHLTSTDFLARRGFTVVSSAWAWDVAAEPGEHPLVFSPPVATDHGRTITGRVANEFTVPHPTNEASFVGISGRAYPMAADPRPVLTARLRPDDPRVPLPRSAWRIVAAPGEAAPSHVAYDGGFRPGVLYELTYTARDPYVEGLGLAGIRDLLAWLRTHPLQGSPPPKRTLLFGVSQTGRLIQQMLYQGFDLDEHGRRVFDGALAVVAGAGRGSFNCRFCFPTRAASEVVDRDYPTDIFPFATGPERDPATGRTGSMFGHARAADGSVPKLMVVNKSTEFWGRAASLLQTTPDGRRDARQDPGSRLYLLTGLQHFAGSAPTREHRADCTVPVLAGPYLRALLVDLDDWVRGRGAPPPSAYPTLASGTLVSVADYDRLFPKRIGLTPPKAAYVARRLGFGPRFDSQGIIDRLPPGPGPAFALRVPRPDADGTDAAGLKPVEVQVPLGTFTGWNPQSASIGFAWALDRFQGAFQPFARTEAERRALGDPRPSLQARYASRADFVAKTRAAAERMVAARTLLPEDVDRIVESEAKFYDRVLAHDPKDPSCAYLLGG